MDGISIDGAFLMFGDGNFKFCAGVDGKGRLFVL
jgi:hypothetical protein